MRNSFITKLAALLTLASTLIPSVGYSLFGQSTVQKKEVKSGSCFYGALTPNVCLRDAKTIGASGTLSSQRRSVVIGAFAAGLGLGLNVEFGWKESFRFKVRSLLIESQTTALAGTVVKGLTSDTDASVTLFAPVSRKASLLLMGGWTYKWIRLRERKQGTNEGFSSAFIYLDAPFIGFGANFKPSTDWQIESGLSYHMPEAKAHLRPLQGGFYHGAVGWLPNTYYRGGRFGMGGYITTTWQMSSAWAVDFSLESISLVARGGIDAAVNRTRADQSTDVMQWAYIDYRFGLKYQF